MKCVFFVGVILIFALVVTAAEKTPLPAPPASREPAAIADAVKALSAALIARIRDADKAEGLPTDDFNYEVESVDVRKTESLLNPVAGVLVLRRTVKGNGLTSQGSLTILLTTSPEKRWECISAELESKSPGERPTKHDWTRFIKKVLTD